MSRAALPATAAWTHSGVQTGVTVAWFAAADGAPAPPLDGCLDVDLESSAVTNTLPVHRLDLRPGEAAPVRPLGCARRTSRSSAWTGTTSPSGTGASTTRHRPRTTARPVYDDDGLVLESPGTAATSA